jgi:hypothetical protein
MSSSTITTDEKAQFIRNMLGGVEQKARLASASDEFKKFQQTLGPCSGDQRFVKYAEIVKTSSGQIDNGDTGDICPLDNSIVDMCKLILLTKAFSGITGSTTERNINFIYDLLTNEALPNDITALS